MSASPDWLRDAAVVVDTLQGVVLTRVPRGTAWASWSRAGWDTDEIARCFADIVRATRSSYQWIGDAGDAVNISIESPQHTIQIQDLRSDMVAVFVFPKGARLGMLRLETRRLTTTILERLPPPEELPADEPPPPAVPPSEPAPEELPAPAEPAAAVSLPEPEPAPAEPPAPVEPPPSASVTPPPPPAAPPPGPAPVDDRPRAERILDFVMRHAPDVHVVPLRLALQTGIPLDRIREPQTLDEAQTARLEQAAKLILGAQNLRV